MKLNYTNIAKLTRGHTFSISFVTKHGEISTMAARVGVASTGGKFNAKRADTLKDRNMSVVYKMAGSHSGFRTVNMDNVVSFSYSDFKLNDNKLAKTFAKKTYSDSEVSKLNNLIA